MQPAEPSASGVKLSSSASCLERDIVFEERIRPIFFSLRSRKAPLGQTFLAADFAKRIYA